MHIYEFAHKKLFPEWIGFTSHKLLFGPEGIFELLKHYPEMEH